MPNQFLTIHKPSRLWSRNTEESISRRDRVGLIGLFKTEEHKRKRPADDLQQEIEDPPKKKRKESVTRFLKKCIPKKKKATEPTAAIVTPPSCEIDMTFKLPVIEWTGGCIYLCLSDIGKDENSKNNKNEQEWTEEDDDDIMHFPKPPNWRASVPPQLYKRRQRKDSCPPRLNSGSFKLNEDSSDDESDMPRTPTTSTDHETLLLLNKIENLNIISTC